VGPLMSITNASFRADIRRGQRSRERAAGKLLAGLLSGGSASTPFALYLRPFTTTERLGAQPVRSSGPGGEGVPSHLDIETLLGRALRDRLPLVALGRPGEVAEGAARILTTDDDWRTAMITLAQRADLIVMTPLAWQSTQWELGWLVRNGMLGKVVMVMPESLTETPPGVVYTRYTNGRVFDAGMRTWDEQQHAIDIPSEWRAAVSAARAFGLQLPPLAAAGALFTLDPGTGKVARIVPLTLSTTARRVTYLRDAIGLLRSDDQPAVDATVGSVIARGTFYRGATLEFTLMRSADAYLLWSLPTTAGRLLVQALEAGAPVPRFVEGYLAELPYLVGARAAMADVDAVAAYRAGVPAMRQVAKLAALMGPDLVARLAEVDGAGPPDP